jgi:hypothetical protein
LSNTPGDDVPPPKQDQIKRELDSPNPGTTTSGPGDSKPLPPGYLNFLNDGIVDQESRRKVRKPALIAAFAVLGMFTASLVVIVAVLSCGFYQALKTENIARFVAAELRGKIDKASAAGVDRDANSSKDETSKKVTDKDSKSSAAKGDHSASKDPEPVKVEAKIYGEIRDSMVPLVALVSILAVAIVVILGTMLKAAFAPHPHNSADLREREETSPVPLIEALKGLVDAIKAAWGK